MLTKSEAVRMIFHELYHVSDPVVLRAIEESSSIKTYKRGEEIHSRGSVQAYARFLCSGVVRGFFLSGKGEEITDLFAENMGYPVMTADIDKRPSCMTIESVAHCEILTVPLAMMMGLMNQSMELLWAYNSMLNWSLFYHWQVKTSRACFTAVERYAWFREKFPETDKVAIGKHIASFLGIAPETLSRIRKKEPPETLPVMVYRPAGYSSDSLWEDMKTGFIPTA